MTNDEYESIRAQIIRMREYILSHDMLMGECLAWNELKQQFGVGKDREVEKQWLEDRQRKQREATNAP